MKDEATQRRDLTARRTVLLADQERVAGKLKDVDTRLAGLGTAAAAAPKKAAKRAKK